LFTTTTAVPVDGVASFALTTTQAGSYPLTLSASSGGIAASASFTLVIKPGPAARLGFTTEPKTVLEGRPIRAAVAVQDAFGNDTGTGSVLVTLTLEAGAGGATLSGTTEKTTANGSATFDDLV